MREAYLYRGVRMSTGCKVHWALAGAKPVIWRKLPLRLDLANKSPTGFEWGYAGSGPAQLAIALLAHALGDDRQAILLHQDFKWEVVTNLRRDRFELTSAHIHAFVERLARPPQPPEAA